MTFPGSHTYPGSQTFPSVSVDPEPAPTPFTPNPYYQYGTADTGGYGGPPNLNAVSPVFAQARHDALIFAQQVLDSSSQE